MKNIEDLSAYEDAFKLFYNLEKTIECIHFTNVVNNCISNSIKEPRSVNGFFDQKEFDNGNYDTEDILNKTFEDARIFFNTYKERFTTETDAINYIKRMCYDYDFSKNFKYLNGFIDYLDEKRLKK